MKKITPMPSKEPVIQADGKISPAWVKFLISLTQAITELQEAVETLQGGP